MWAISRQQVRAGRAARLRARAGLGVLPPGQALQFMTLDVMPHAGAGRAREIAVRYQLGHRLLSVTFTAMTRFRGPAPRRAVR